MAIDDIPRLGCGRASTASGPPSTGPPPRTKNIANNAKLPEPGCKDSAKQPVHCAKATCTIPALKPRPGIKNAIMDVARAEVRRGSRILLRSADNGITEISEQALSSLIRFAAAAIPGVHSRRCRIEIRSSHRQSRR